MHATEISTSRFGAIAIEPSDVLHFPDGIPGLPQAQQWVLLADAHTDTLGWLQSTTRPELALAVVSPRRYVPDYQVRLTRSELSTLSLAQLDDARVLVVVSKHEHAISLNLKAPLLINMQRRIGRQVVNVLDLPVQYELGAEAPALRKSA